MGTYIIKRLFLMIPTLVLISLLVFVVINLAPGRAGQVQLTGGEGESVREAAGAREGYLLFKLGYGLNRPLLFNTRFGLGLEDVRSHVETIARNLTATVPGETEAHLVADSTGAILSHLVFREYWELTDRLASPDLGDAEREALEARRLASAFEDIRIRPPRPPPADVVEAQEDLENWGMYAVPHLLTVAREHASSKVRWQAVEFLTLLAQDRDVDPRLRAVVARHPERQIERLLSAGTPAELGGVLRATPLPGPTSLLLEQGLEPLYSDGLRLALPRYDVRNWHFELGAPPDEVETVMARWEAWYERNRSRMEHDFWERVGIFFLDTRLSYYWGNLIRGNLGVSSQYKRPVTEIIFERWQYSIYLSLLSVFFAYFLSVPIGLYSAVKQGGLFDQGVGLLLFLLYSLPSFFVATLLSDYLTHAQEPETVWAILRWAVRVVLVGVIPLFIAALYRGKARERGLETWRHGLASWAISAGLLLGLCELLFRLGIYLLAFLLIILWPTVSTLRAWRRERRRVEGGHSDEHVPFPWARLVGLAAAGLGVTWVFALLKGFFPAPVSGFVTEGLELRATTWTYFKDVAAHLVFPVASLTYLSLAVLSRYARTGLLDVIRSDYIRTARAKGLSESVVILKHAVRNGMIPILTLLATTLPALIGGSVIIEVIFGIPGIGQLVYSSVIQKDFNVIMGVLQISALLTLIGILLSDISYALVDPRITFD